MYPTLVNWDTVGRRSQREGIGELDCVWEDTKHQHTQQSTVDDVPNTSKVVVVAPGGAASRLE